MNLTSTTKQFMFLGNLLFLQCLQMLSGAGVRFSRDVASDELEEPAWEAQQLVIHASDPALVCVFGDGSKKVPVSDVPGSSIKSLEAIQTVLLKFYACRNAHTSTYDFGSHWYSIASIISNQSYASYNTLRDICLKAGYKWLQYAVPHANSNGNNGGNGCIIDTTAPTSASTVASTLVSTLLTTIATNTAATTSWTPFRFYNTSTNRFDYFGELVTYRKRCNVFKECLLTPPTSGSVLAGAYRKPQCTCPSGNQ